MFKLAVLLAVVAFAAAQQEITYTAEGTPYTYTDDESNLSHSGVTEACKTGCWLMHTGTEYGGALTEIFPNTVQSCHNPLAAKVGSTRYIGKAGEPAAPSASLFHTLNMGGEEILVDEQGIPSFSPPIISVVTINTNLQLFQNVNYEGSSTCVPLSCNEGVCWSWTLPTGNGPDDWDITTAQSARIGCTLPIGVHHIQNARTYNVL